MTAQVVWIGVFLFYLLLQSRFLSVGIFEPTKFGLVFNDMLLALLDGRFDLRPEIVGEEGFVGDDGMIYSYFGILPALLRLPLVWLPGFAELDLTGFSTTLAVTLAACLNTLSVRRVISWHARPDRVAVLTVIFATIIVFSGPAFALLGRPAIFHEAVAWSYVFASLFLYSALPLVFARPDADSTALLVMALAAAAALLTRVSTGLGLYVAMTLLLLVLAMRSIRGDRTEAEISLGAIVLAGALLLLGAVLCAGVNYGRWGDPFLFADLPRQIAVMQDPDRIARLAAYGAFNLERTWIGLSYYFLPLDWLAVDDGHPWSSWVRLLDRAEAPPGSFLLLEPVWVLLSMIGLAGLVRKRTPEGVQRWPAIALAAGLSIPPMLMLVAIYMAFRYRVEFMPLLLLLGFIGLASLCRRNAGMNDGMARWRVGALAAFAVVQCIGGGVALVVYQNVKFTSWTYDFFVEFTP